MKTPVEDHLLEALAELDRAIQSLGTAPVKPNLLTLWARIDRLAEQLAPQTDPTLLHYLRKKSYAKARRFLEGRETQNQAGHCRHV